MSAGDTYNRAKIRPGENILFPKDSSE